MTNLRDELADILEPDDELIELPPLPPEEHIGNDNPGEISWVGRSKRAIVHNGCILCWQHAWMGEHAMHRTVPYVRPGGARGELPATHDLGLSAKPLDIPAHGPRRVLWDLAYGYVNGFPPTAIAYFILTRSIWPRPILDRILAWERKHQAHA